LDACNKDDYFIAHNIQKKEDDMRNLAKKTSLVFAAGCLGGLVNSLAVWIFGDFGITAALGVKIAPQLSPAWLYPRLVWGGIWGLLFLLGSGPAVLFSAWARPWCSFSWFSR
jgi:hypothetical protein